MEYSITKNEGSWNIAISGRFTFTDNTTFRSMLEDIGKENVGDLVIDVSHIEYIDSAALGMFLLLRDFAEKKHILLTLKGAQGQVKKIFDVSRFDQLFRLG